MKHGDVTQPHPQDASEHLLRISHVAQVTGVSDSTLRTWERRYGVGPSVRTPGAHRLYTPDDVMRLGAMASLIARGVSAGQAACDVREATMDRITRIVESNAEVTVGHLEPRPCGPTCGAGDAPAQPGLDQLPRQALELLEHCEALDPVGTLSTATSLLDEHGAQGMWEHVVTPILRYFAKKNSKRDPVTDIERFLTAHIQQTYARYSAERATPNNHIILATTATEPHCLPLYAVQAALSCEAIGSIILTNLPFSAVIQAAQRCNAKALLLYAQQPATSHATARWGPISTERRVILAGCGWHLTSVPSGVAQVGEFRSVLEELRNSVNGGGETPSQIDAGH